jgi:hypothetical protein
MKKMNSDEIRKQLEKDLEEIMDGGDNIEAIQKLKEIEEKKRKIAEDNGEISHEKMEAARKIIRIYRANKIAKQLAKKPLHVRLKEEQEEKERLEREKEDQVGEEMKVEDTNNSEKDKKMP